MVDFNGFQAKVQEQLKGVQEMAREGAKELEAEARKAFASLNEKTQAELKGWLTTAQATSREQIVALGGELMKLGKRLQDIASRAQESAKAKAAQSQPETPAEPPAH